MPGQAGTLETLAGHVGLALQPLETQLTPANLIPFLAQLGIQFPPQLLAQAAFMGAVNSAASAAGALPNLLSQLATDIASDDESGVLQDGLQLVQQIGSVMSALDTMGNQLAAWLQACRG